MIICLTPSTVYAQWHRVDTFVNNEHHSPLEDPAHCSRICQLCATVYDKVVKYYLTFEKSPIKNKKIRLGPTHTPSPHLSYIIGSDNFQYLLL